MSAYRPVLAITTPPASTALALTPVLVILAIQVMGAHAKVGEYPLCCFLCTWCRQEFVAQECATKRLRWYMESARQNSIIPSFPGAEMKLRKISVAALAEHTNNIMI